MIISVSRRTDIPAFYSEWFFNRIKEGFVYVQNPINPKQVSKIQLTPEKVVLSISASDSKSLMQAQGVGSKLAQRIILELKDKLKTIDENFDSCDISCANSASKNSNEAVNALVILGYSPSEASLIVAKFDSSLPVEDLIKLSLKAIGKEI